MEFRILGPMEVWDGARSVTLPAGRGRALLALLLLHAGEAVPAERLIDELWGEHPPATASTAVQGLVSRLRRELEPGRGRRKPPTTLQTAGSGYVLAIDPDDVDANRFQRLLATARRAALDQRAAMLADALRLWRGPALADFVYEPFAQRAITALEDLRVLALEDRVEADLALGRHGELVAEIEQLIHEHPFRERLRALLMLALYRAGRQADALEAYQGARHALVEEMGIEPGPELQSLHAAILRHDGALERAPHASKLAALADGADRDSRHWLPVERRTVTLVCAELAVSVESDADPEAVARFGARAAVVATDVLRRHGGRVEPLLGDVVAAFFGLPVAHEDDAVRAVRAAVELRAAVDALNADGDPAQEARFSSRTGIETGEVVVGGMGAPASGPLVTTAARLQQVAASGDVYVGPTTQQLISGAVVVKPAEDSGVGGPGDAVAAWRVLDVVPAAPAVARRFDTPMRGRQAELTQLRTVFRRTVRLGAACRVTLLGEAGIGKTRLAREFVESIGDEALVVTGHCPPYGEGITFLPLREALLEAAGSRGMPALRELLGRDPGAGAVADQIAAAIGLKPQQGRPEDLFPAVRRMFEALAARRPVIIVFEDLHWAEPTLLDLIEFVSRNALGRVLLLGLARPELTEGRPEWAATGARSDVLRLGALSPAEIEELIDDRAGQACPAETVKRVVDTAGGNPLFAEQLLAAFDDASVDAVPASLRGLLAMRLDKLGPGERDIVRCASVVGSDCDEEALDALMPNEAAPFVRRHLAALERKQLIARTDATAFRFNHVLIQLAAYQSMAREDRARLHERFADWLEGVPEPPPEVDEIIGYHLEQAIEHRRASGAPTRPGLATRAGERLASASQRALSRFDLTAAENLLSRARSLLPPSHGTRAVATQRLAEICLVLGRFTRAQELLLELAEASRAAGDTESERSARLEHARIQFIIGPDPVPLAAIEQEAEHVAATSAALGDDAGQCRAAFLHGCVHMRAGRITEAEQAFSESLAHADRLGDAREELATRWMLASAITLGSSPVAECISRCEDLAIVRGGEHPGVLIELAMLAAMTGRLEAARELNERARRFFVERMRVRRMLMYLARSAATVEMLAGQTAAAERELRAALALARGNNERNHVSQTAARLSLHLRAGGRSDEADSLATLSAQAAPADGIAAQALSRAATARAASDASNHREALRQATAAVRLVPEEMLNLRGDVLVQLAVAAGASGDQQAASAAASEAARLHERKGRTVPAAEGVVLDGGV